MKLKAEQQEVTEKLNAVPAFVLIANGQLLGSRNEEGEAVRPVGEYVLISRNAPAQGYTVGHALGAAHGEHQQPAGRVRVRVEHLLGGQRRRHMGGLIGGQMRGHARR